MVWRPCSASNSNAIRRADGFIFCNRGATAAKTLMDDGHGFWLCRTQLSQGRFGCRPVADAADEADRESRLTRSKPSWARRSLGRHPVIWRGSGRLAVALWMSHPNVAESRENAVCNSMRTIQNATVNNRAAVFGVEKARSFGTPSLPADGVFWLAWVPSSKRAVRGLASSATHAGEGSAHRPRRIFLETPAHLFGNGRERCERRMGRISRIARVIGPRRGSDAAGDRDGPARQQIAKPLRPLVSELRKGSNGTRRTAL